MSVHNNRKVTILATIGVLAIVLVAGIPLAQSALQAADQTFTGCLRDGKLEEVAIGDAPLSPCDDDETQVSWNAQGSPGADGATWFSGATLPSATLGADGDLYLLLADSDGAEAGDVFVKESGTWVTKANLEGPQGPQGPQGDEGPQGPPGPADVTQRAENTLLTLAPREEGVARVSCNAGEVALGGGWSFVPSNITVRTSGPTGEFRFEGEPGWFVVLRNDGTSTFTDTRVTVYVVCTPAP